MIPFINTAYAAGGIIPECATKATGAEDLECVMQLFVQISNVLFGVLGSIMLVVFVYGGLLYLFSQGDSGKVSKATTALKGGVVGLAIVFGSFTAINFVVSSLKGESINNFAPTVFYSCGGGREVDGKLVKATVINDGKPCAAGGFICKAGVCIDPNDK